MMRGGGEAAADKTLRQRVCRPSRGFHNDSSHSSYNCNQSFGAASAGPGAVGPDAHNSHGLPPWVTGSFPSWSIVAHAFHPST